MRRPFCPAGGPGPGAQPPPAPAPRTVAGRRDEPGRRSTAPLAVAVTVLACATAATAMTFSVRGSHGQAGRVRGAPCSPGRAPGHRHHGGGSILLSPARPRRARRHPRGARRLPWHAATGTSPPPSPCGRCASYGMARPGHRTPGRSAGCCGTSPASSHFYALTLEARGWVLSKQDPAYRGDERFLASGRTPGFPVGLARTRCRSPRWATGDDHAPDGHLLTRFTDTQRPYLTGALGAVLRGLNGPVPGYRSQAAPQPGTPLDHQHATRRRGPPGGRGATPA